MFCRKQQSWTCSAWTWTPGPGLSCKKHFHSFKHTVVLTVFFLKRFDHNDLFTFLLHSAVCLSSISDVSQSSAPLGRSMFTMTPTSDHTLFIYGGLGVDGNTLSKSRQKTWSECDASTFISKCSHCTSPAASVRLMESETVDGPQPSSW